MPVATDNSPESTADLAWKTRNFFASPGCSSSLDLKTNLSDLAHPTTYTDSAEGAWGVYSYDGGCLRNRVHIVSGYVRAVRSGLSRP